MVLLSRLRVSTRFTHIACSHLLEINALRENALIYVDSCSLSKNFSCLQESCLYLIEVYANSCRCIRSLLFNSL